jgi:hypothetical protein
MLLYTISEIYIIRSISFLLQTCAEAACVHTLITFKKDIPVSIFFKYCCLNSVVMLATRNIIKFNDPYHNGIHTYSVCLYSVGYIVQEKVPRRHFKNGILRFALVLKYYSFTICNSTTMLGLFMNHVF